MYVCVILCVGGGGGGYGPSRLFHSFWDESIVRWGKTGDPREKTPASRTWLASYVTQAKLEPKAGDGERFRALKVSDLNHSPTGAACWYSRYLWLFVLWTLYFQWTVDAIPLNFWILHIFMLKYLWSIFTWQARLYIFTVIVDIFIKMIPPSTPFLKFLNSVALEHMHKLHLIRA